MQFYAGISEVGVPQIFIVATILRDMLVNQFRGIVDTFYKVRSYETDLPFRDGT